MPLNVITTLLNKYQSSDTGEKNEEEWSEEETEGLDEEASEDESCIYPDTDRDTAPEGDGVGMRSSNEDETSISGPRSSSLLSGKIFSSKGENGKVEEEQIVFFSEEDDEPNVSCSTRTHAEDQLLVQSRRTRRNAMQQETDTSGNPARSFFKSFSSRSKSPFRGRRKSSKSPCRKTEEPAATSRNTRSRSPIRRMVGSISKKISTNSSGERRNNSNQAMKYSLSKDKKKPSSSRTFMSDDSTDTTDTEMSESFLSTEDSGSFDDSIISTRRCDGITNSSTEMSTEMIIPIEEELGGYEIMTSGSFPDDDDSTVKTSQSDQTDPAASTKRHVILRTVSYRKPSKPSLPLRPQCSIPHHNGLYGRHTTEQIISKLRLGHDASDAIRHLRELQSGLVDPSADRTTASSAAKTTKKIHGVSIPDYEGYVSRAMTTFRRNVLGVSDDAYDDMKLAAFKFIPV